MNAPIQQPDLLATFSEQFDRRVRAQLLRAAAGVLRAHPDATLGDLVELLATAPPGLLAVRIAELLEAASKFDGAKLRGPDFDAVVLRVLAEHRRGMSRAELIARVGGPRWKLQASMRRLEGAGKVARTGITSATRYSLATEAAPT